MAEMFNLGTELGDLLNQYFYRSRLAEESRAVENRAAVRIQSWIRACEVMAHISHMHKMATRVQKLWRGFTVRVRFRQMVKVAYFIMKMNAYNQMAIKIQRRWRGFYVRKYIHDFYARKRYLDGLAMQTKMVRKDLDELGELQKKERDYLERTREHRARVGQAHRLHHLLSTMQCPGVYNSPFREAPHEMELLMRQVKFWTPTGVRDGVLEISEISPPTPPSFPETLESRWMKSKTVLSTSAGKNPQASDLSFLLKSGEL